MPRRLCPEGAYPFALPAIAAYRLPGSRLTLPREPLEPSAWQDVLRGAWRHRLTGALAAAVHEGAMAATGAQISEAVAEHRTAQLRVLLLERELAAIVRRLTGAGVATRVLKGPAYARLDYPDPALRSFHDIDLLVRPADIDHAAATMRSAGYRRTLAEPRPGFDRRFDKGMTLIPPAGYELDIHRTFVLGPWGVLMDLDELWRDEGESLTVAGHPVTALSLPYRLLHACYHAALGDWPLRLGSLRDVAELLRKVESSGGVHANTAGHLSVIQRTDPARTVRAIAARWGVEAVLAAAVADTTRLLCLPATGPLSSWARDYTPSRQEEAWLALHTTDTKTFAAQALATVRVLPRWRDKLAYIHALALPDRGYTDGRHSSRLRRFAYALRQAHQGRAVSRRVPHS
ncbi:nucleotidyltransferase family protein [Haloechinothrix halophila]|uniref:nucleotidyltransferase family protein n=1 Tax=Haloechinothrix halophila TaxID=1069073 RepID=UPI00040E350A|nr:nucleotidyltransferase family protein [Haloechinothrix halophila]